MKLIIAIFAFTSLAVGQSWYKGEAAAVGGEDMPISKLRQQALTKARVAVLEQSGISIKSNVMSVKSESGEKLVDMYGSFAQSDARGIIVEERKVKYSNSVREERGQTIVEIKVSIEARIEIPEGKPDLTFEVQLLTDKTSYYEGEDLQMTVTSTKDGYLSLFQIKNDSCFILYPHPLLPKTKNNNISANVPIPVPPADKPYSYELNIEGGDGKSAAEFIVAVVTKEDYPIGGKFSIKEYFSLQEFNEWLIDISVDKRSSASSIISIIKK